MSLKRKLKKVIFFLIILVIVLNLLIINKKFLKFVDQIGAKGQNKIASWSFDVSTISPQKTNIKLNENYDSKTIDFGYIAPGTEGEFNIKIDAENSNTGAEYEVKFENETKKPSNLKYIYKEKQFNSLKEIEPFLKGIIYTNDESKTKNFNIKWAWKYETGENEKEIKENDRLDTLDSENIREYKFDVIVQGKQIEPKEEGVI